MKQFTISNVKNSGTVEMKPLKIRNCIYALCVHITIFVH